MNGKYSAYIYNSYKNLYWSYTRSVTPREWYFTHLGMSKETGMIFLGGDNFYTRLYGRMKDVKFYFNSITTEGTRLCN